MHCHTLLGWGKNSSNTSVTKSSDFNNVPVTRDIPIHRFPGDNMDHRERFIDGTIISRLDKLMGLGSGNTLKINCLEELPNKITAVHSVYISDEISVGSKATLLSLRITPSLESHLLLSLWQNEVVIEPTLKNWEWGEPT